MRIALTVAVALGVAQGNVQRVAQEQSEKLARVVLRARSDRAIVLQLPT
jgi:hypothetical protein